MPTLPDELRTTFENEIVTAREVAEKAAEAALTTLAVKRDRPFDTMSEEQRQLRRALRARARQLGGGEQEEGMPRLVEEIAYEQWHRLLFSSFLAENDLLMHPEWDVPVSLEECAELAPEEGAADRWELAARYAVAMLPGIFLLDDPALQVRFAPEGQQRLEQIVTDLPKAVFTADDSLGWAYQFWQSKKKDEVNASERKIGGADLYPVTQLFTEDYMVKFLLHNSLGAWWAARHPDSRLLESFDYLRYRDDETPAAGTFDGWPDNAADVTVMDPCCGSGHFLVAAFDMLTRMRMEEEGLSVAKAGDAVIRDNLFGLEIDPRCTQIAAFNLALTAWKSGGYRDLPIPNVACSGIPVQGQLKDWVKLAGDDEALQWTMKRLYYLFRDAPDLGSLINPAHIPVEDRMFVGDYERVEPLLEGALSTSTFQDDPTAALFGQSMKGIVKASRLLADTYVLISTNVPYLGSGAHDDVLKNFCELHYPEAAADLATVFLQRCREFASTECSYATVTPQNWLFLVSYEDMRVEVLKKQQWDFLAWIGEKGFSSTAAAGAFTVLLVLTNRVPRGEHRFAGIDVAPANTLADKERALLTCSIDILPQDDQLEHPGKRISFEKIDKGPLLANYASSFQGIKTGDDPRFRRYFWEVAASEPRWRFYQSTVVETKPYGGLEYVLDWANEGKDLARLQGLGAWNTPGVAVSLMRELRCANYMGGPFDSNMSALVVSNPDHFEAVWAFASSGALNDAVRATFRKTNASDASLIEVPFNLEYWQKVSDEAGPLPEPYSDDPTQWLFEGNPADSTEPLQVAIVRLAGYQWPEQAADQLTPLADEDGILCLPAVAGEATAAERLRTLLAKAYGEDWSLELQRELLAEVDFQNKDLEKWLRDGFFLQHSKLFSNRPFIWHIWDGRRDGFNVLVNYHKLDHARLERLIYTYLGDWIRTQKAEQEQGVSGAEGRLVAALELKEKLELILEGEPPYDIYVRWKELHEQPIGWNPDLNDGVRLNIRPFVKAGVLRRKFTIHWKKDRGKNPDGSLRYNDLHFTRAEKEAARENRRRD